MDADVKNVAAHCQSSGDHRRRRAAATALERLGKSSAEVVGEKCVEDRVDCAVGVAEQRHHLIQRYRPSWQRSVHERTDHLSHDGQ